MDQVIENQEGQYGGRVDNIHILINKDLENLLKQEMANPQQKIKGGGAGRGPYKAEYQQRKVVDGRKKASLGGSNKRQVDRLCKTGKVSMRSGHSGTLKKVMRENNQLKCKSRQ
jgi:hypothetical protein